MSIYSLVLKMHIIDGHFMVSVKRAQSVFLAHGLNIFLLPPLSKVFSNRFEYFYIASEINTNNCKIGIKYCDFRFQERKLLHQVS